MSNTEIREITQVIEEAAPSGAALLRMDHQSVRVRELAGWDFDDYEYRPGIIDKAKPSLAARVIAESLPCAQSYAAVSTQTELLREMFRPYAKRPDLIVEMSGLSWSFGVVDLRSLIAFQRRLSFNPRIVPPSVPLAHEWAALFALSFGPPKSIEYEAVHDGSTDTVILRSDNPNLHVRVTNDLIHPLSLHAGSPFFEVASFRGRWFLRDGYHRAYALLRAGVYEVPAVVVEAGTIEELGANQPWFFPERVLFSTRPPQVIDFLNEDLVLEYDRPQLMKTVQIKMEEHLKPVSLAGEQS